MPNQPDQADIIAQNEQLAAELKAARGQLATATQSAETAQAQIQGLKEQLAEAQKGSAQFQATLAERTKERDALKAESDALKARDYDFNKAVAAEVAKRGIREHAAEQPHTDRPMTATEKVLAAKGVSSLAELEQLRNKK